MHQGQVLVLLLGAPQKTKLHNCYPDAEGLGCTHDSSLTIHSESLSTYKLRSAVSVGFPIIILTNFAHIISSPSLQLDSWNLAQCLVVDLCGYFHQVLEEGSMTIRVATNLNKGKVSSGTLSTIARSFTWGYSCVFLGVSLAPGFCLTP